MKPEIEKMKGIRYSMSDVHSHSYQNGFLMHICDAFHHVALLLLLIIIITTTTFLGGGDAVFGTI